LLSLPTKEWWLGFRALWRIRSAIFSDSVGRIADWIPVT
jgi:hypothetical protein